jgi:hypothetical protein
MENQCCLVLIDLVIFHVYPCRWRVTRRRLLHSPFTAHALPHSGNIITPLWLHDYHIAVTWLSGCGNHAVSKDLSFLPIYEVT